MNNISARLSHIGIIPVFIGAAIVNGLTVYRFSVDIGKWSRHILFHEMLYPAHVSREDKDPCLIVTAEYPEDVIKATKPCSFEFNPIPVWNVADM